MPASNTNRIARIAAAVAEALHDLDVPDCEVARGTGVSRPTVAKIRAGRPVRPDLLMKVAAALLVYELHSELGPEPSIDRELADQLPLWKTVAS
ncbi:MAG: helix-turn-helix domain-containing protein [Gaiellaceae bacterium]